MCWEFAIWEGALRYATAARVDVGSSSRLSGTPRGEYWRLVTRIVRLGVIRIWLGCQISYDASGEWRSRTTFPRHGWLEFSEWVKHWSDQAEIVLEEG